MKSSKEYISSEQPKKSYSTEGYKGTEGSNDECRDDPIDACTCGVGKMTPPSSRILNQQNRTLQEVALRRIVADTELPEEQTRERATSESPYHAPALVDSHCHLQLDPLHANSARAVALALELGVQRLVVCGTEPGDDWRRIMDLYEAYPQTIVPNFGLHPWWIKKYYPTDNIISSDPSTSWDHSGWLPELVRLLERCPSAGVGECGLDKNVAHEAPLALQEAVLAEHLRLAGKYQRALTLHCVGCWDRLLVLLTAQYKAHVKATKQARRHHYTPPHSTTTPCSISSAQPPNSNSLRPNDDDDAEYSKLFPASIILHSCLSMPIHLIPGFARLPHTYFSISMAGRGNQKSNQNNQNSQSSQINQPNHTLSAKALAFLRAIPPDRLLLETDAPDQLPVALRMPRNTLVPSSTVTASTGAAEKVGDIRTSQTTGQTVQDSLLKETYCQATNQANESMEAGYRLQYNEPALLRHHCAHLARVLGVAPALLARQTTENAFAAFKTMLPL